MLALFLVLGLVGGGLFLVFGGGVSKAEFIEEADTVCQETFDESLALTEAGGFNPEDLDSYGRYVADAASLLEDQTTTITAMEIPEEDRSTLDDWLDTQRALAEVLRTAATSAVADDQKGFEAAFADANAIQSRSGQLAAAYGFEVCGLSTPA